jgi:hypothetical protein
MLDLFCGRGGWTNAFLARGWEVVGVDLVRSPDYRGQFIERDVMEMTHHDLAGFDFICASSPCEQFSVHGMKHFHPNPPYPEEGIRLFNGTRYICEAAGVLYVMENVRAAQQFIGKAAHHCGPFYLWGNAVPTLLHQGIIKAGRLTTGGWPTGSKDKKANAAKVATIPPELANCVADYAERILEQRKAACDPNAQIGEASCQ